MPQSADHYIIPEYRHLITGNLYDVFNTFTDGLYISDRDGTTIGLNKSFEKISGYSRHTFLGKNIADLVREGVLEEALNPQVVQSGQPASSLHENREGRKILISAFPLYNHHGEVDIVVTTLRDITLRVNLQDQVLFQRDLLEQYQENIIGHFSSPQLMVKSPQMIAFADRLERLAVSDATVFLQGETGTGKGVFAQRIHVLSDRVTKPFFRVNCSAIPEDLIEAKLFGEARVGFGEASGSGRPGLFELAHSGTLFLDEVGDLPTSIQARLLRVLQEGVICRAGETKERTVDVRIVAATNRDLEKEVSDGTFRSDLYYRLHVAVLEIPSLRERKEDVLFFVEHFLALFGQKYRKHFSFSFAALDALEAYAWPGNVRELENMVHNLVVSGIGGEIDSHDLPFTFSKTQAVQGIRSSQKVANEGEGSDTGNHDGFSWDEIFSGKSLKEIEEYVERRVLQEGMERHDSISSLAKTLKTERSTLSRKLKRYGITGA